MTQLSGAEMTSLMWRTRRQWRQRKIHTHTHADASYTVSPLLSSSRILAPLWQREKQELSCKQTKRKDLNKYNSNTHTHTQTGESGMAFLSSVKFEYLVLRLNFRSERSGIASVSLMEQSNRSKKEEEKYKTGINRRDCSVSTVSAASASVGKFLTERIAKNDKE